MSVVSTLTPMVLYITVPETMKNSAISVYSVADSVPKTYIRLSPRIMKTTSTQATIAVQLTELSVKTGAMYKIDHSMFTFRGSLRARSGSAQSQSLIRSATHTF